MPRGGAPSTDIAGAEAVLSRAVKLWNALALKAYPNGAVMFCSDEVSEVLHPLQPLRGKEVFLGNRFDTAVVQETLRTRSELTYGVIVIDGDEATLGIKQAGTMVSKLTHLPANIASRTRRGGQSAARYSRNRDTEELAFLRKVAQAASDAFRDFRGVVIGGRADMKNKLLVEFPRPLRERVSRVVDLQCGAGIVGLQKTAAQVGEVLEAEQHMGTEVAVGRFFERVAQSSAHAVPLVCYGEAETLAAVKLGAVEQLLVARNAAGFPSWKQWSDLAMSFGASFFEVHPTTDATLHFCNGFGVGACLRYPVDFGLLEEPPESDQSIPSESQKPAAVPPLEPDCESVSTATSHTSSLLLSWLQDVLKVSLQDASAAESLAMCADVVLSDESCSLEDRLENVVEMLREEGAPDDVLLELACHVRDME